MIVTGNNAYGVLNGYETNASISNYDTFNPLKIHVSYYGTTEQKSAVEAGLRNAGFKNFSYQSTPYGLYIGLSDITLGRLTKRLPDILNSVCQIIYDNGGLGKDYDPFSGKILNAETSTKAKIDNLTISLCKDSIAGINSVIDAENKDFKEAPNNYLKGFLGALIGAVVGAGLSVIINIIGYISAYTSVIAVLLGAFLFQKFGGKPDKMMIIIVAATTLVLMLASIVLAYIISAGIAGKEYGYGIIESFKICMSDAVYSRSFYCDLALTFVFSALGVGVEIFYLLKKIKRKKNIIG